MNTETTTKKENQENKLMSEPGARQKQTSQSDACRDQAIHPEAKCKNGVCALNWKPQRPAA